MYVKVDNLGNPANTLGSAEDPQTPATPFSSTNTRLYIGTGGSGDNSAYPNTSGSAPNQTVERTISLNSVSGLEGGQITFSFGGVQKTVTWDDSTASVSLDRTNYGPGATAYVVVEDQDMNLDPTAVNTFSDTASAPANQNLTNGVDKGSSLTYTETGANTGKFEITYTIGILTTGTSQGRSLTVNDFKNFTASGTTIALGSGTGGSGSPIGSSSASYTVQRVSGGLGAVSSVTYAGELPLTVSDSDRNLNSKAQESLNTKLQVNEPSQTNKREFNLREQSQSSNTFVPAYGQDRIILTWKQNTTEAQGILKLLPGQEATIRYEDDVPSTGGPANTSSITIKPTNTAPTLSADKTTVGRSSVIGLTMNDPELNDDSQIVESYTVTFTGTTAATNVPAFPSTISPFSLKIDKNGAAMTISPNFSVTFTETGPNTGVFTAEVDLSDLAASPALADGDTLKIEVNDILEPGESETADVSLTVGLEKPTVKVDRSTVPVPRLATADDFVTHGIASNSTGSARDNIANTGPVDIVITITDPNRNNSTINEETLGSGTAFTTVTGGNVARQVFSYDGGRLVLTLDAAPGQLFANTAGITMTDALKETGFNTGIFQGTIRVDPSVAGNDDPLWIGAKLKIEYKGLSVASSTDDANAVTVTFTARQAVLSTDTSTVVNGGEVTFTVTDQDSNRDPDTAEKVKIRVAWTGANGNAQNRWLELEETGKDTGVFTETIAVGDDTIDGITFDVESDSEVDVFYYDATPSVSASTNWPALGSTNGRHEKTLQVGAASGSLDLGITGTSVGPSSEIDVTIFDTDVNTNPNTKQIIGQGTGSLITVATDAGIEVQLDAEETTGSSARFVGTIKLQADATPTQAEVAGDDSTEVTIPVSPGDVVSVRYEDQNDENGRRTTISKQFTVVSVDPEITTDKNVYAAGDQMKITLADLDRDRDPDSNDIVNVKATSTSDLVGLSSVQLIETGPNTGVFEGTLTLSAQFSSGSLTVKNGDVITIKYTDDFPADYEERVDAGGTTSKDFVKTVPVGTSGTTKTTTPSKPELKDAQGRPVTQVLAGQQVVLSTTVKNNEAASTPYAAIVEVRDSKGITVFLNWQTGTLQADGTTGIGLSWTPETPGTYTARVFVLSGLTNPQILSETITSTITVS
ncbi:hypothetical protein Ngar_c00770 [Candidatus Nitrososphaera gargensis Ga9.2]|uniref:Uncharacterized protein n=1 Tax=Nitrososphaera gargensis (strain Ga9.2) TaxID=1237085 RepID=K0IGS6_NITGG|nr:hypothetical protein [Candidatus Nitrososphaera gargensis]AFU57027.1 hypothetical protein Ngar_c00770 [Candidatus Nitrososphaera gargensis Ga9.2]